MAATTAAVVSRLPMAGGSGRLPAMRFLGALLFAVVAVDGARAADPLALEIRQPHPAGHQLGDRVEQRIRLPAGHPAFAAELEPAPRRIDAWLEWQGARAEVDGQGERWLVLAYQVVNTPDTVQMTALPELALPGPGGQTFRLPAAPLAIGPYALAAPESFDSSALRADRMPATTRPDSLRARLQRLALVTAALVSTWLAWWLWRNRRDAQRLPFDHARRALARIPGSDEEQRWRVVHEALDRSALRVVHAGSIDDFVAERPEYAPMRQSLEKFFASSNNRFFARAPDSEAFDLIAFVNAMRRLERQAAR